MFTLLIACFSALTITSCTEEEVSPNTENGGTGEIDTVLNPK